MSGLTREADAQLVEGWTAEGSPEQTTRIARMTGQEAVVSFMTEQPETESAEDAGTTHIDADHEAMAYV